VIVDLLAAAGSSATQYTLTVGSQESEELPGFYFYGYTADYGTLTPTTFRSKSILEIQTLESTTFYFSLASTQSGKGLWDRMEFIRNGVLEKAIYSAQCSYVSGVGGLEIEQWTATSVGWTPVDAATYTVRIYW